MFQDEANFLRIEPGIDGDQDAASRRHGKMGFEQRRGVGTQEGYAVMFLHAAGAQAGSQAIDTLGKRAVGILLFAENEGTFMGKYQRAPFEKTAGSQFSAKNFFC